MRYNSSDVRRYWFLPWARPHRRQRSFDICVQKPHAALLAVSNEFQSRVSFDSNGASVCRRQFHCPRRHRSLDTFLSTWSDALGGSHVHRNLHDLQYGLNRVHVFIGLTLDCRQCKEPVVSTCILRLVYVLPIFARLSLLIITESIRPIRKIFNTFLSRWSASPLPNPTHQFA